jgi:di/tricarboxylate transporter
VTQGPSVDSTIPLTFRTTGGTINAYGISIRFQASDLLKSTPTGLTPNLVSSTTTPNTNSENGHSLSTGSKAGIGVAVALVVLTLVGLLGWVLVRRRTTGKKNQASEVAVAELPENTQDRELPGSEGKRFSELPGNEGKRLSEVPG